MKKRLMVLVMVAVLFIPQLGVSAGKSNYQFYGFSKDSKYCAFETYGYHDGSGFPYSNIYFIDTAKNKYATKPIRLCDSKGTYADVKKVREANLKKASKYFTKYNIKKNDMGKLIFTNSKDKHNVSFKIGSKQYKLNLTEKNLDNKETTFINEKGFELRLSTPNKGLKVLQKDSYLPKSRAEAMGYNILSAYYKGNKLVVFLEYEEYGFEGSDFSQMIVTGTLT